MGNCVFGASRLTYHIWKFGSPATNIPRPIAESTFNTGPPNLLASLAPPRHPDPTPIEIQQAISSAQEGSDIKHTRPGVDSCSKQPKGRPPTDWKHVRKLEKTAARGKKHRNAKKLEKADQHADRVRAVITVAAQYV